MTLSPFTLLGVLSLLLSSAARVQADPAVDALIQQGDVFDLKFEPTKALEYYLAAEKIEPENLHLLLSIARQYRHQAADTSAIATKLRLSQKAMTYAKKAQAKAPEESETHLSVAITHAKMVPILANKEKIEASREVRKAVDKAIELDPGKELAWHVLGSWHQRLSELGSVKRAMAKLLYGSLPEATPEQAVKCFQTAILLNPKRPMHHIELGRTYAQMGKTAEAKKAIEKGLALPNVGKDDADSKALGRETLANFK
jgi:tetratricopeptide (TPR) repeat protein